MARKPLTYLMSINSDWDTERSSEPKICQLDGTIVVYEKVLGFEISVQDTTAVAEKDTVDHLMKVALKRQKVRERRDKCKVI